MSEGNKMLKLSIGRGRGIQLSAPQPESSEAAAPVRGLSGFMRGNSRVNLGASRSVDPPRPAKPEVSKVGKHGKSLELSANYFRLVKAPDFEFCMYRVDFKPEIDNERMRKAFVYKNKEFLGGYLYDGASIIYFTHKPQEEYMEYECESKEGKVYTIQFKFTGTIQMTDSKAIQVLNLILRRTMDGLEMKLVGRNLYDPENKVEIKEYKVELWPGYITSIRQHEDDILVCAEVSHKVMRVETVYEIIKRIQKESKGSFKKDCIKEIVGTVVLTDYNNQTYRVDDIDFDSSPTSSFEMKGKMVTYKDYFEDRYTISIRDPEQPMLVSKPKARDVRGDRNRFVYLVPELCRSTGLTDRMRGDFRMMKAMACHTRMDPTNRKNRLLEFTRRLHQTRQCIATLEAFNTNIEETLVEFKGRALPQETMFFGNSSTALNTDSVDWTSSMKKYPMYESVPLQRCAIIYPKSLFQETVAFLSLMNQVADGMNYKVGKPIMCEIEGTRINDYTDELKRIFQRDPKFIMVFVPNNAADRYAAIKKLTYIEKSIPSQVLVKKTITPKQGSDTRSLMSIATKVIVQINCKLGGIPWMLKLPINGYLIIGFDVTHDTNNRAKSFGAFVASMSLTHLPNSVKYYSAVSSHSNGEEASKNINVHMKKVLLTYKKENGCLPERILFYRDGVGDGQIEYVNAQEVSSIEATFQETYTEDLPKFTFFIVNKRVNTRIFQRCGDKVDNPKSGTVVDNTITLPERYDFFLVSQSVRQGTVSPTSYIVLHDTNQTEPDKLQGLTYKLCHLYYNWSGTVRVPAPVQYAHKLSILAGEFLHGNPSVDLGDKLYFL